ncbi:MAG: 1-(5-phosphoribosyl)-5-((5-phosphoribosylamino)methylideneamino)imidazole-4-carboxamide isomerase, partial [Chloroflexi bacterium]|nr:1-(5-phosphoribosyl)-5-((5-phosphoribosylamino)methylideneamino)imidazole-4-carboxamide isomerase [Chloroflexota bacterium]
MEVIPAIDILGGKCVRLFQGDYSKETVFSNNPVGIAKRWPVGGAPRI